MPKPRKTITLPDFLSPADIERCRKICDETDTPNKRLVAEVIGPQMDEINRKLGQENDASFLAYAVEYVMNEMKRQESRPSGNN